MSHAGGLALALTIPPSVRGVLSGKFAEIGQATLIPADKGFSPAWLASLTARGRPDVAAGDDLKWIGMPVGGLCCGQVYLSGTGQLWHWDIFHQKGGGDSQGGHYAKPMPVVSPILQGFLMTIDGNHFILGDRFFPGNTPGRFAKEVVDPIFGRLDAEFENRYPIGVVRFKHPLVTVELEAFSPFIPLETDDSSMPLTVMQFTVKNVSSETIKNIVLSGNLWNPVGDFLGQEARMEKRSRVHSGNGVALLEHYATPKVTEADSNRPEIVFEDFEGTSYEPWKVEGDAFGKAPFPFALVPDRKQPSKGRGKQFVNTHESRQGEDSAKADTYVGKLTSPEFTVSRRCINFLIGGGNHPGETCINLIIEGKVVRSETGRDGNAMRAASMDTAEFEGKKAHLEIVDSHRGGWGHITLDAITFADQPWVSPEKVEDIADFGSMCLGLIGSGLVDGSRVTRSISLKPGESHTFTFFLTWFFPNLTDAESTLGSLKDFKTLKRHYAKRYRSARDVANDFAKRHEYLVGKTREFAETWYDSTLPHWFLARTLIPVDCLATATSYRFNNGRFYGWEGTYCCAGTCQHVWNYAQAGARLFPELERSAREHADYGVGWQPDGTMHYRSEYHGIMAHDGQAGTIIRTFREHTMTSDTKWLTKIWPKVKTSVRRLMKEDTDGDGILDTWQYNTLDDAWAGKISWISSMYLAAVRCGSEMAKDMKDDAFAKECEAIIEKGSKSIVEQLYDGEIFVMKRNPEHPEALGYGPGCHVDQVFGDSLLYQVGLDPILPRDKVKGALGALFKYNFAPDAGGYKNSMQTVLRGGRWYAMPGEGGLVMTSFPKGGAEASKGKGHADWIVGYFNECMNGFEYQAAAHMIAEGLVTEGLAVVRSLHDRYSAPKRNPYNEIECSDHYSRSMASYGAFLTMCGFRWHGPRKHLAFAPKLPGRFRAPFTTSEAWGTVAIDGNSLQLKVRHGVLSIRTVDLPFEGASTVTVGGKAVEAKFEASRVKFSRAVTVREGQTIRIGGPL